MVRPCGMARGDAASAAADAADPGHFGHRGRPQRIAVHGRGPRAQCRRDEWRYKRWSMIRPVVGAAALAAALIALVLSPVRFGADVRRAAGVKAVQLGLAPLGAAIFRPLARGGDAVAQNNLAILLNRGIGVARDPVEAARLLNAAATAGLGRAQVNLLLLRSPCDSGERSRALAALEGFARAGDRRAASFVGVCLSWSPDTVTRAAGARLF